MLFEPILTRVLVFLPNRILADAVSNELMEVGLFDAQACAADPLAVLPSFRPDIVVVDPAQLPGSVSGWLAAIQQRLPACQVLAYVGSNGRNVATSCLAAGLSGVVSQGRGIETLIEGLTAVQLGGVYLDHDLSSLDGHSRPETGPDESGLGHGLSERERSVLEYVARGFSNKEIAAKLGLSAKTVETYRSRASGKLGFRRKSDIVQFALHHNWLVDHAYAL